MATTKPTKKTHWDKNDVEIVREGSQITLPASPTPMPIAKAIEALQRKQKDEEQETKVLEYVKAFPLDGAVAFMKAMQRTFGWASAVPIPGFFGPQPPTMVGVQVSPTETIQVPYGRFELPGVDGFVQTSNARAPQGNEMNFVIAAVVKKKDVGVVKELAKLTRKIVTEESIYKGKALRFMTDADGDINYDIPPEFIDTTTIDASELILNDDVLEMVTTSVFTPIRNTQQCRDNAIPLNRGVLLEGTYGVGKTMIARCCAKVCEDNGWTFLLLDKAQGLQEGLLFARRYSPAVVFVEDIDRVTAERDEAANDLLNTIDGILSKDAEVISVMTTNHVETINKAMLRPGRLDAVVSITPPDALSVQRLIRTYARDLLATGETLDKVGAKLAGAIPAVIREVTERSKLRAIPRSNGGKLEILEVDLLAAAHEMNAHLALLKKDPDAPTASDYLAKALDMMLQNTNSQLEVEEALDELTSKVRNIHESVC